MKRFTWIVYLLLCTICTIHAKDRVIKRPPFIAWSSTTIEINKIILGDTATTVYIKAFQYPKNWIRIAIGSFLKDKNGMLYPIRRGIGITLGKNIQMPESGEIEFQLIFPPIPATVTSVDFSEGDFEGAYKIWGIQLNKKGFNKQKLPKEVVMPKIDKKTVLPIPKLAYGKATLKGKILDYQRDMFSEARIQVFSPAIKETYGNMIKINEDGTFQTEFGIATTTNVALGFPFGRVVCMVAPGEETSIIINTKELCRRQSRLHKKEKEYREEVYFQGYLAGLQQEMGTVTLDIFPKKGNYTNSQQGITEKNVEEYKNAMLESLPAIRKRIAHSPHSIACKEFLNIQLDMMATDYISTTVRDMGIKYREVNKLDWEKAAEYFRNSPIKVPDGYYNVLKEFSSINTLKALYNYRYESMLRFFNLIPDYENVLKEALQTDKGPLFDNLEINKIYAAIQSFTPMTAEQNVRLETLFPPAYGELLVLANKELLQKMELNKKKSGFTINNAGEVINEELFPSIISKFRDHVLLVDFWATWCGPCRTADKMLQPMKEELKDKDIIYLYLTGETSPKDTWKKMIPDIHGEHFRVKDTQWKYLIESFSIKGIPTYFVIDREGNITYRESGFSGVENMKNKLLKALNE